MDRWEEESEKSRSLIEKAKQARKRSIDFGGMANIQRLIILLVVAVIIKSSNGFVENQTSFFQLELEENNLVPKKSVSDKGEH